jgi:hypothetical protein
MANEARMTQLVLRWLYLVNTDQTVLFVRQHGDEPDIKASAAALVDTPVSCTSLTFDLLYLVPTAAYDPTWQVEGVTFKPHRHYGPDKDWRGYEEDWDAYFASFGIPKTPALALGKTPAPD